MSRALAALGFALRRGALRARRRIGATAWAALAAFAALFALGAARSIDRDVAALTAAWPHAVDMVVYLDPDVDQARAAAIAAALGRLPAVERVEVVPPAAALAHLRESLGPHAELVDQVEPGLLPASLEVALAPGVADVAVGHPVIERLRRTPGVEDVEFLGDFTGRTDAVIGSLRRAGAGAVAIAALLAAVMVAAAVRLAVAGRRRDGRLLELIGAGPTHIGGPAVVHGALAGLIGGGLATLALALVHARLSGPLASALGAAAASAAPAGLPVGELAALPFAGLAIGALGGLLAARGARA